MNEPIPLVFRTVKLTEHQVNQYTTEFFNCYQIKKSPLLFKADLRRLLKNRLVETVEFDEIQPFIRTINSLDFPTTIKVGQKFAVLEFSFSVVWREVTVLGFTIPKIIEKIVLTRNGEINYIQITDSDTNPRLSPINVVYGSIIQAAYFKKQSDAEQALSLLALTLPDNWTMDTSYIFGSNDNISESNFKSFQNIISDNKRLLNTFDSFEKTMLIETLDQKYHLLPNGSLRYCWDDVFIYDNVEFYDSTVTLSGLSFPAIVKRATQLSKIVRLIELAPGYRNLNIIENGMERSATVGDFYEFATKKDVIVSSPYSKTVKQNWIIMGYEWKCNKELTNVDYSSRIVNVSLTE
jgi:hypothetical protein